MPTGKPFNPNKDEVIESIERNYGRISHVAAEFHCSTMTIRRYIDIENLQSLVDEAQEAEEHELDDLAVVGIKALQQRLEDEPSVALKAAISTLTRKRGTRTRWIPDNTSTTEDKANAIEEYIKMESQRHNIK